VGERPKAKLALGYPSSMVTGWLLWFAIVAETKAERILQAETQK